MSLLCRYCVAYRGVTMRDALPDQEALYRHIEDEHHVPVEREGETPPETAARFAREHPEAGGPNCRCPACRVKRGERPA